MRYLSWFFRHVWYLVLCFCLFGAFALLTLPVPAQVLTVFTGTGLQRWRFFPDSAVFALVLGLSVLFKEFFALELVFLGCTCGVAFSLRMPLLRLGHRLG